MRSSLVLAMLILGLLGGGQTAWPQSRASSSGLFGNRNLGSSLNAGNRTFAQGMAGQGMAGQGMAGQVDASDRFLRGNRRAGDFVGTNAQDAREFAGAVQAGSGMGSQSRTRGNLMTTTTARTRRPGQMPQGQVPQGARQSYPGQRQYGMGGMGGMGGNAASSVRSRLRIGFDRLRADGGGVSTALAQRLAETPAIRSRTPIQVELQGRTAILRGEVASDHDRVLAGQMARLEPGIDRVQNDLVVAGRPSELSQPWPEPPPERSTPASLPQRPASEKTLPAEPSTSAPVPAQSAPDQASKAPAPAIPAPSEEPARE